jgi:hypothetical protein
VPRDLAGGAPLRRDHAILTALGDGDKRRTDYTLTEVEQALARAQVLEVEARALRSTFRLFINR